MELARAENVHYAFGFAHDVLVVSLSQNRETARYLCNATGAELASIGETEVGRYVGEEGDDHDAAPLLTRRGFVIAAPRVMVESVTRPGQRLMAWCVKAPDIPMLFYTHGRITRTGNEISGVFLYRKVTSTSFMDSITPYIEEIPPDARVGKILEIAAKSALLPPGNALFMGNVALGDGQVVEGRAMSIQSLEITDDMRVSRFLMAAQCLKREGVEWFAGREPAAIQAHEQGEILPREVLAGHFPQCFIEGCHSDALGRGDFTSGLFETGFGSWPVELGEMDPPIHRNDDDLEMQLLIISTGAPVAIIMLGKQGYRILKNTAVVVEEEGSSSGEGSASEDEAA